MEKANKLVDDVLKQIENLDNESWDLLLDLSRILGNLETMMK